MDRITDKLNIRVENNNADIYINGIIGYDSFLQHDDAENRATSKEDMQKELKAIEKLDKNNIYKYFNNVIINGNQYPCM